MTADILRSKFLAFFKARKHRIVESDSLVPRDDPTVLFTPAGMNQFKKQFLGHITDFTRAVSSQRCLRTDDLDKVGKTTVHHTFFEMLGNFSFGDYFKSEAISWAWEFLTDELKIGKDKLWVSVYKDDEEAYLIWKDKIGVSPEKIIKLGDHDNFWPADAKEKGPNGPCGPCSEIFFDFGEKSGCGEKVCDPTCSCGRFAEIWNLVFTQFDRMEGGRLQPLPKKNIDTGMGLERLAAVMQGASNNFETELFQPLIKEVNRRAKKGIREQKEFAYAIADHIRAITFAIYDGVLPSNESRGYVIRKLIRKSALHLRSLGINEPFLYTLVPVLCGIMKNPYPDLLKHQEDISRIILSEEKNFTVALQSSSGLFREKFSGLQKEQDPEKTGIIAFQLYDTYGIPLELTMEWLAGKGIKISIEAFDRELELQKSRSKSQSAMKGDVFADKEVHLGLKETKFNGYSKEESEGKILKIFKVDKEAKKIIKGEEGKIVLDKTCFYAESGGQVGDTGKIKRGKNIFQVLDTKKFDKVVVHLGKVVEGSFKPGDEITSSIDIERRLQIARNHTATHLLQAALRNVLGEHVKQQGSLVAPEKLRFDFSHFKDLSDEELSRVEEEVNRYILENHSLQSQEMILSEAKKTNALAFFGEKYDKKVRVVSVSGFSKEFCGGTHLDSTGQIGLFKITQEGSVASGIRRIEAVTGLSAYKTVAANEAIFGEISRQLNAPKEKIIAELQKRLLRVKELEKQLSRQKSEGARQSVESLIEQAKTINGIKIISSVIDNLGMDLLRNTVDLIKKSVGNCIIALGSRNGEKALLVIGVTEDLVEKGMDASLLIREVSQEIGGSGGGRKDFAQAGGVKPENFGSAFTKLEQIIRG